MIRASASASNAAHMLAPSPVGRTACVCPLPKVVLSYSLYDIVRYSPLAAGLVPARMLVTELLHQTQSILPDSVERPCCCGGDVQGIQALGPFLHRSILEHMQAVGTHYWPTQMHLAY